MKKFAPRVFSLGLSVVLLGSIGIPVYGQALKDVHYQFRNVDYEFKVTAAGSGLIYEGNTAVASVLTDGRIIPLPGQNITNAEAAYKAWKSGAAASSPANQSGPGSPEYAIRMFGPHMGQILQDGKPVALIIPASGSPTGETVVAMSGGKPPSEAVSFYETSKRNESGVTTEGVASSGAASRGTDGRTPTVQFINDPHFGNDLVEWRKGHIEIRRDGDKFADLGYTGGGYREGAAKRGIKIGLNEISAAVSRNRKADVFSTGWEITTAKGTYNTAVQNANRAPGGITQTSPFGFEGEAVAATELYKKQVDQAFTYPGYDKLCKDAGTLSSASTTTAH